MLNNAVEETLETTNSEPQQPPEPPVKAVTNGKQRSKATKPRLTTEGPIYLLLSPNGKYKELAESELPAEAAGILKDPALRLVKGQFMVPEISFKLADE